MYDRILGGLIGAGAGAVSYTHLDVYKRQHVDTLQLPSYRFAERTA